MKWNALHIAITPHLMIAVVWNFVWRMPRYIKSFCIDQKYVGQTGNVSLRTSGIVLAYGWNWTNQSSGKCGLRYTRTLTPCKFWHRGARSSQIGSKDLWYSWLAKFYFSGVTGYKLPVCQLPVLSTNGEELLHLTMRVITALQLHDIQVKFGMANCLLYRAEFMNC